MAPAGRLAFEVLLIHRPRYDDWTLPKGKADAGGRRRRRHRASREVWEETGLRGRLGADLGEIHYEVKGRPKVVRYWAMEVDGRAGRGSASSPTPKSTEWRGSPPEEAKARLVYLPDAQIVDRFLASWSDASQPAACELAHASPTVHLPST